MESHFGLFDNDPIDLWSFQNLPRWKEMVEAEKEWSELALAGGPAIRAAAQPFSGAPSSPPGRVAKAEYDSGG